MRLNRTLLLLTKIDNGQFPELSDIDIAALVRGELEIYTDLYSHRSITASATIPDSCIVRMNDSLANTLITNLLKNAFVHSTEGAQVTVTLTADSFVVANNGDEPLDETQIFERFYHSGKSGSTGLGLPLVNSICRYYGFEKSYTYKDGQHLFTVRFK